MAEESYLKCHNADFVASSDPLHCENEPANIPEICDSKCNGIETGMPDVVFNKKQAPELRSHLPLEKTQYNTNDNKSSKPMKSMDVSINVPVLPVHPRARYCWSTLPTAFWFLATVTALGKPNRCL
ncbi:hypothetical protein STEG23_018815 [Scotinomys teguina]